MTSFMSKKQVRSMFNVIGEGPDTSPDTNWVTETCKTRNLEHYLAIKLDQAQFH